MLSVFPADGIDSAVAPFIADVLELAGLFRRIADEIAGQEGQTQARWCALGVFSEDPRLSGVPQPARIESHTVIVSMTAEIGIGLHRCCDGPCDRHERRRRETL